LAPGETTADPGHVEVITNVTAPQLFVYPLSNHSAPAPAVLILPGGGYGILATDVEGVQIARWLNSLGYVAAVLHYRVPNKRDKALQDAQRAMSLLRAEAAQFGIDPKHLGVIGFSAGGHLAARLSVSGDSRTYPPSDASDQQSCRPDFALLIYPAYLIDPKTSAPANEVAPVADMPPMLLAQSKDDHYFCAQAYAAALSQVNIKAQLFLYDRGGHGYGLGLNLPPDSPVRHWPTDAAQWLQGIAPAK
jgi:acetyl esterase/lipase